MSDDERVYAVALPLIGGRRFWVMRTANPSAREIADIFTELDAGFDHRGDDPVGLCALFSDPDEMGRRPEAVWPIEGAPRRPEPSQPHRMFYAGYLPDGRQVRIAYFTDAKVGPGSPDRLWVPKPPIRPVSEGVWELDSGYRVERFDPGDPDRREAIVGLWRREGVVRAEEARRRISETLVVVLDAGEPIGVCTAYRADSPQLGLPMWHLRFFVATAYRRGNVMYAMEVVAGGLLEQRFTSGEDTTAPGLLVEIEHTGLNRMFNEGVGLPLDQTFVGENKRGDWIRVRYFPGALAPLPGSSPR